MALFGKVNEDIKTAMKERDKVVPGTLRNIKRVFSEAKTAPGANDTLGDADVLKIIRKLTKQGKESAQTYIDTNRQDLADAELVQVPVIKHCLLKQLSEAETEEITKTIIGRTGAASVKDMEKVVGMANRQLAGKVNGKTISGIVRKLFA